MNRLPFPLRRHDMHGVPSTDSEGNTNRGIVIVLIIVVFLFTVLGWGLDRNISKTNRTVAALHHSERVFEQQIATNCFVVRDGNTKVNGVLDQLVASVKSSTVLTPAEKADRVSSYESLRLPVGICPPTPK